MEYKKAVVLNTLLSGKEVCFEVDHYGVELDVDVKLFRHQNGYRLRIIAYKDDVPGIYHSEVYPTFSKLIPDIFDILISHFRTIHQINFEPYLI